MAARKKTGSKSDQIRALLASGLVPAEIAKQVGCSRNLVYVVKANQGGTRRKAHRKTARKSKATRRSNSKGRNLEQFLASVKALQRERDELQAVLGKIRVLVNGVMR